MKTEETFQDVKKVASVSDTMEANKMLKLGWRLLRVLAARDEGEYPIYIFGWHLVGEPQFPKKFEGYY